MDIEFADSPDPIIAVVAEDQVLLPGPGGGGIAVAGAARADAIGLQRAFLEPMLADQVDGQTEQGADGEVRQTDPPQAPAGGAHGGEFLVAGVVGERVKQGEQQGHGDDHDQEFRSPEEIELNEVEQREVVFLIAIEVRDEIGGGPKDEEPAQAIAQR